MRKMGKHDVIMTLQICENDLQNHKYFFHTYRHISFKIGWIDFPYKKFIMYNFAKSGIFHVFAYLLNKSPIKVSNYKNIVIYPRAHRI